MWTVLLSHLTPVLVAWSEFFGGLVDRELSIHSGFGAMAVPVGSCLFVFFSIREMLRADTGPEISAPLCIESGGEGAGQNGLSYSVGSDKNDGDPKRQEGVSQREAELEKKVAELEAQLEERKQVEIALRDSEWKFRTLVENLNIGVFRNTVEGGRIVQTNTAMAKIFGYDSVQDFYGISVTELYLDMVDRQKFLEEMRTNGFVKDRLIAMRKKDGTPIWCSVTAVAHYDSEGRMECSDGVLEDVTERKRLEEQLRHSQKMEAIGTLTGGIAHDFNNMLTAILGYANLLKLKVVEDPILNNYVEQILTSSEKAAHLTKSLLAFSRKQIINPRPVNLNEVVSGVEKLLMRVIGEDIEFKTILADRDLVVMADSGQMEQILLNLATNARDAMDDGGRLIIETSLAGVIPQRGGLPNTLEPGNYAVISVSDTGGGMDEAMCQRIFEPFYTTKEMGRGTGLGLSIVYGIIRQHRGDIQVYSEPGAGTTFKIYLPIAEQSAGISDEAMVETPLVGGNETILVAEDNDDVRNLMCSMLQQFGYTVIEAVDGEDAVEKFSRHIDEVDLLLLDVVMPRMNGKECLDKIRAMNDRVPVIFSSGYTADIIHAKGIHEEGAGFIQKPVQPQAMLSLIREILQDAG
ncbi:PAS domain S-box-containing protein [Desulfopila aestuarii DSM 18488]|uniref:histidine kinase n=1 Tax=Desulfopila aestuarii DSM 18488 TaxID=1121416 RepID=A0A1M7Y5X9_9BACT|nr:PAS domain S-box-containing protein [Desulfopila aestuarii DSM 18488]